MPDAASRVLASIARVGAEHAAAAAARDAVYTAVLTAFAAAARASGERLDAVIEQARADGLSWRTIGKAIGMSGEGARQRWGIKEEGTDG